MGIVHKEPAATIPAIVPYTFCGPALTIQSYIQISSKNMVSHIDVKRHTERENILDGHRDSKCLTSAISITICEICNDSCSTKLSSQRKHTKSKNYCNRPRILTSY